MPTLEAHLEVHGELQSGVYVGQLLLQIVIGLSSVCKMWGSCLSGSSAPRILVVILKRIAVSPEGLGGSGSWFGVARNALKRRDHPATIISDDDLIDVWPFE